MMDKNDALNAGALFMYLIELNKNKPEFQELLDKYCSVNTQSDRPITDAESVVLTFKSFGAAVLVAADADLEQALAGAATITMDCGIMDED